MTTRFEVGVLMVYTIYKNKVEGFIFVDLLPTFLYNIIGNKGLLEHEH